jgi:hypothetical protein
MRKHGSVKDVHVHLRQQVSPRRETSFKRSQKACGAAVNATTRETLGIWNGTAELGFKTQLPKRKIKCSELFLS